MSRYYSEDELFKGLSDMTWFDPDGYTVENSEEIKELVRDFINSLKTADVVEVVRCKECIYAYYSKAYRRLVCDVDDGELVDEDFFCSCGRRKEEK